MRSFDGVEDSSHPAAKPFLPGSYDNSRATRRWRFSRGFLTPSMIPVGAFLAFYLLALLHCRYTYVRDPTSFFFDPDAGYAPRYSAVRQEAADAFVDAVTRDGEGSRSHHALGKKNLCVGMASVARDNARYFRTAVGSLLEGLSDEERGEIHLILFIAQTDPTVHPAYWESWLSALADQVLLYNQTLTDEEMQHIKQLEIEQGLFREKALFDYTYLLKACSKVDAPYIAILEDDVLAMGGWYHRTMTALETAESKTRQMGAMSFLYLRLFYTEEFFGWNSENWPTYLFWSVLLVIIPAASLLGLKFRFPRAAKYLSKRSIAITSLVCIPMCIILYFMAGKLSMQPLPAGVHEMSNYGCCSQALVFQQKRAQDLINYYTEKKIGFVDMLTEELADRNHEIRWALTPSVMQHVGSKSSKGDDFGEAAKHNRSVAEKIWNFAFEDYDAEELRREHERIVRMRRSKVP